MLISCDSVGTCIDDNRIFDMLVWFGLCYINHSLMSVLVGFPRENLFYRFLSTVSDFRPPRLGFDIMEEAATDTTGRIKSDQQPTDANKHIIQLICFCGQLMMRLRVVLLSYDEGCGPLARRSNVDCHGPEHLDLPTCSLELKSQVVKSKAPTAYQQKVIQDSYFPGFFSSEMPESQ